MIWWIALYLACGAATLGVAISGLEKNDEMSPWGAFMLVMIWPVAWIAVTFSLLTDWWLGKIMPCVITPEDVQDEVDAAVQHLGSMLCHVLTTATKLGVAQEILEKIYADHGPEECTKIMHWYDKHRAREV